MAAEEERELVCTYRHNGGIGHAFIHAEILPLLSIQQVVVFFYNQQNDLCWSFTCIRLKWTSAHKVATVGQSLQRATAICVEC